MSIRENLDSRSGNYVHTKTNLPKNLTQIFLQHKRDCIRQMIVANPIHSTMYTILIPKHKPPQKKRKILINPNLCSTFFINPNYILSPFQIKGSLILVPSLLYRVICSLYLSSSDGSLILFLSISPYQMGPLFYFSLSLISSHALLKTCNSPLLQLTQVLIRNKLKVWGIFTKWSTFFMSIRV